MDQGTLQGIGTILAMVAFLGICWWAYSGRNKKRFDEAGKLPFVEDEPSRSEQEKSQDEPESDSQGGSASDSESNETRGSS
ncbi:MAG: cbb3-type cytochrome c oxidase subunit 3 [Porticoccaceae bacterium]